MRKPGADQLLVVDQGRPGSVCGPSWSSLLSAVSPGGVGSWARTRKPPPGRGPALTVPAEHRRPLAHAEQTLAEAVGVAADAPRPSSLTSSTMRVGQPLDEHRDRRVGAGVLEHVGQRLLRDPVHGQPRPGGSGAGLALGRAGDAGRWPAPARPGPRRRRRPAAGRTPRRPPARSTPSSARMSVSAAARSPRWCPAPGSPPRGRRRPRTGRRRPARSSR